MGDPCYDEPDQRLVAAAKDGEVDAWAELVRRYYPPLLRYLTSQTNDPDVAAELTQDTFLAADTLLHRLPADRPFAGWLYRIAQNLLRRMWRRRKLRRFVSIEWLLEQPARAGRSLSQSGNLESQVAEEELVQQVLNGLSSSKVAAALAISLPAAERRISRAKEQFRARYNALIEEV